MDVDPTPKAKAESEDLGFWPEKLKKKRRKFTKF